MRLNELLKIVHVACTLSKFTSELQTENKVIFFSSLSPFKQLNWASVPPIPLGKHSGSS